MRYFITGFIATLCSLIVIDNKLQKKGEKK